ncbi:MAG: hypothetical protein Kow0059_02840 [Candidatus Sumerlaeia bacterium]
MAAAVRYNRLLLIVALILATVSAAMLMHWFDEQKAQIEYVTRLQATGESAPDLDMPAARFYSNLSRFSLIVVIACFSLLCYLLAVFWHQHHQIQQQRLRFQSLYDSAPVMYFTLNPQFQITGINETGCQVLGRRDLTGRSFIHEIAAVQDRGKARSFLERVARAGSGRESCRWVCRDGRLIVADMICTAEYDSNQQMIEILICAQNITEQEAANERIFFLSKILEYMDDVVIVTDVHGVIQYVNLSAERLFLYPSERLIGRSITILFDQARLDGVLSQIQSVVNEGGIWQGDIHCVREDGFGVVAAVKVSHIRELESAPQAIIYTMRDITFQKQIILELRQSEEKYRTIFDQAPLSIVLLDARGNIMDINRWHIKHVDGLKTSRADYLMRNIFSVRFFTEAGLASSLRDLLRGEAFELSQVRFETDDRRSFVMSVSGTPLFDDNHVVLGALLILEDVTERYELQEQLWRHAVELEEKTRLALQVSRLKSEFLANVSHELRTPLNAIIGFTRLVMRKNKALIAEAQYRNLQHILDSAYHLLELINSVLDLSKIEAGRMEVHAERFQFQPFIESIVKTAEPLMEENKNLFIPKIDPGIHSVYNDPTMLRQVIVNLLSNAAKFTQQGTVVLKITQIPPSDEERSAMLRIEVIDSGIGIPEDKITEIFEAFRQADGSTTRRYGGTGLGLTITRRLCTLMRGRISVASVPGKGTTFTVLIPVDFDREESVEVIRTQEDEIEQIAHGGSEVALVVHDDQNLIQYLRRLFAGEKIVFTGASSYQEALNKTQYLLPAVIFLDLWHHTERAWRLLRTLKTQRHTWKIPIMLLNSRSPDQIGILPCFDAVFKPATETRLLNLLEDYQKTSGRRLMVVDDDVEFLNMAAEIMLDLSMEFDVARNYQEAYQTALQTHPGVLLMNLTHIDDDDVPFLKRLVALKSISAVCIVAWQRMSDEEFTATLQHIKLVADQFSLPLNEIRSSLPSQFDSLNDLLDLFRRAPAPPTS